MNQDKQPQKPFGFRKALLLICINLAIMFAILMVISFGVMPGWLSDITGHNNRVVVPNVIGMTADEALFDIDAQGLRPMIVDTVFSDGHKPGVVLDQLPEGNLPVKPGRIVYLTINSYTTQSFPFPDVAELSSRQAISELEDQYYVVDSLIKLPYEFDDLVLNVTLSASGKTPQPGEMYPKRTHVKLYVGSTTVAIQGENEEMDDIFFE